MFVSVFLDFSCGCFSLEIPLVSHFVTFYYLTFILDSEPPVITCPSDIEQKNLTEIETRVNWDRPYATDNSGDQPILSSSRQSGDLFDVPGSYEIVYTAEDGSGNKATCSFRITLESK